MNRKFDMGFNGVVTRKVSLNGFAEGWDECFLRVKAMSRTEAKSMNAQIKILQDSNDEEGLDDLLHTFLLKNITGGSVLNTLEDGTTEPYELQKEDVPEIAELLSFAWQIEILGVATGANRLKSESI